MFWVELTLIFRENEAGEVNCALLFTLAIPWVLHLTLIYHNENKTKVPAPTKGYSEYPGGEVGIQSLRKHRMASACVRKLCALCALLWRERRRVRRNMQQERLSRTRAVRSPGAT